MKARFDSYDIGGFYDETFEADLHPRPHTSVLMQRIASLSYQDLAERQIAAERALLTRGITFNVYGSDAGVEKIFPFDIIPRVIAASEWTTIERGLVQRVRALEAFLTDVYGAKKIVAAGIVPDDVIRSATSFLPQCIGLKPPRGIWCHVVGTDLVRDRDGQIYVLEDNIRCPSGVSYVLENRQVMKRTFPHVFGQLRVRPVDVYPSKLLEMLQHLSTTGSPTVVVLTPGVHNSAYFEHSFLAQQMGVELVEGRDLVVMDGRVHMRTTRGFQRVDVIYRRIDDTFIDPAAFRPDSMLGVRGHVELSHMEERLQAVLGPELHLLALELLTETAVAGALTVEAASFLARFSCPQGWDAALRDVLDILQHDGYLGREQAGYRFVSRLLRDWWRRRFELTYVPVSKRERPHAPIAD